MRLIDWESLRAVTGIAARWSRRGKFCRCAVEGNEFTKIVPLKGIFAISFIT